MNRREFTKGCVAAASAMTFGRVLAQRHEPTGDNELDIRQSEIDAIAPKDFAAYWREGVDMTPGRLSEYVARFPALGREAGVMLPRGHQSLLSLRRGDNKIEYFNTKKGEELRNGNCCADGDADWVHVHWLVSGGVCDRSGRRCCIYGPMADK